MRILSTARIPHVFWPASRIFLSFFQSLRINQIWKLELRAPLAIIEEKVHATTAMTQVVDNSFGKKNVLLLQMLHCRFILLMGYTRKIYSGLVWISEFFIYERIRHLHWVGTRPDPGSGRFGLGRNRRFSGSSLQKLNLNCVLGGSGDDSGFGSIQVRFFFFEKKLLKK